MRKIIKRIALSLAALVTLVVLIVVGYVLYVVIQYSRIEDNHSLEVVQSSETTLTNGTYSIVTYNIGFGAYDTDFSFFMDSGEMLDGKKVTGTGSRAKNYDTALKNTNGVITDLAGLNADFVFCQEVDTSSTRSHKINQVDMLKEAYSSYSSVFASNFHSAYLFYPIFKPHGTVNSGIVTLSKYKIESAVRRSFPVDDSFPWKFFDLDRCFSVSRAAMPDDKELVLINLHMSAYDEGGKIRALQLEMLKTVMAEEYEKGGYIIVGGDFNHDIASSVGVFETQMKKPDWVAVMDTENDFPAESGFVFATAENSKTVSTCRSSDLKYVKGINYEVVIDGFIVSDNIKIVESKNIETGYLYSDHQPVKMTFTLE